MRHDNEFKVLAIWYFEKARFLRKATTDMKILLNIKSMAQGTKALDA